MASYFVGVYARGPKWLVGKTVLEQPLEAHFTYMEGLESSRILVLGGPFGDDEGALAIITAPNPAEARRIFAADPAVTQGIFRVSVHPWSVSVAGEVSREPW